MDTQKQVPPQPQRAVCLLSGGLDSTACLALALQENDSVLAVGCHYGSSHNLRELQAARSVVEWFASAGHDVQFLLVVLPDVFEGGHSALMGERDMPSEPENGPSATIVPFRNANLLSVATSLAVTNGCQWVYAGMHAEDARNWAYPDCTPEFLGAMANAIRVGTGDAVRLKTPFEWDMKADVVLKAAALEAPAHLTWTCYQPVETDDGPIHCGVCPACVERVNAFKEARFIDPAEYNAGPGTDDKFWEECDTWPTN